MRCSPYSRPPRHNTKNRKLFDKGGSSSRTSGLVVVVVVAGLVIILVVVVVVGSVVLVVSPENERVEQYKYIFKYLRNLHSTRPWR